MTNEIIAALSVRFAPPEYILFEQFALFEGGRRLDALIVSPWAARGYSITGFEFKVSRADWLRELKSPWKAEEGSAFCDRWFVVAPQGIIGKDEAPEGWGVIELRGRRLFTTRQAVQRDPVPIDRAFMARCIDKLAKASRDKTSRELGEIRSVMYAEISAEFKKDAGKKEQRAAGELEKLQRKVEQFETASGITIDDWRAPKIGAIVRQILHGRIDLPKLSYQRQSLQRALEHLTTADQEIEALRETLNLAEEAASA